MWKDLEADIADMFGDGHRRDDAEVVAWCRYRYRKPLVERTSRIGRVLAAVRAGARKPSDIARAACADVNEVRHDLQILRRSGRIAHRLEGWVMP